MTGWRKCWLPFLVIFLAPGLLSACLPAPAVGPPAALEQGEVAGPPELAAGPVTRITHDQAVNTGFGEAVDISGDTLVVGASDFNVGGGDQHGSVYVYQRAEGMWRQHSRLAASDGRDGFQYDQHFGRSVAIEADTIVVGAPDADHPQAGDNTGAVYVFRRVGESWEETAKLEAAEPRAHARFGNHIRIHGETLAVAGDQDDELYVFAWDGSVWVQQARLELPLPPPGEWRQVSLALYGDILAAGATGSAPFDLDGSGMVLVYERQGNTWVESARLEGARDFGVSAALAASAGGQPELADTLVVGAGGDTHAGLYAGAVYVYTRQEQGWDEQARLTAADALMDLPFPANNAFFGSSVALQGDLLLVEGRLSSAVYVYQRAGDRWIDGLKVIIDQGAGEFEAWPLAIDGSTVARGSPGEFGNSAHVFEIYPR